MRIYIYFVILSFISGCSSINSAGTTVSNEYQNDLHTVYIIFDDFVRKNNEIWTNNPDIANSVEKFINKIGDQGEAIWPKIFNDAGIQAEVSRTSKQKQISNFSIVLVDAPKTNPDYDLIITQKSVTPHWFGMFTVNYKITLRDRKNRTAENLWEGNLEIQKGLWPSNEFGLAKIMADKLIAQMKLNGINLRR